MNKDKVIEMAAAHNKPLFEIKDADRLFTYNIPALLAFASALTEPYQNRIKVGEEGNDRLLEHCRKFEKRIADLEAALVIADRDRKNAELAIDDAEAERLTVSPEVGIEKSAACVGLGVPPCECTGWGCLRCCANEEEVRQRQGSFS